ncbi:tagaturonate reductase [Clostridium sp. AL.422]|uniref:tagaturonate reductase n=1 Tax=Clostridium TaxID=1485 RepID=UPI00293DD4AC|nr:MULTISPECIES: tagaturonate reductase [unclassified Clostridium]MDV4150460.1 tagaturonate reductase [Clostridium sp. AL.422]
MRLSSESYKDYKQYKERIIQFGEGNFLRAFVDWIVDKMNDEIDFNTGVVVVQPLKEGMVKELNEQDGLYSLYIQGIENGEEKREVKIINSITRGINPYIEYEEYLKLAKNPYMRFIVSNTTEAGISYNKDDKYADDCPTSFPAKVAVLLYERYKEFNGDIEKGFIFLPCELIEANGEKLKEVVITYAEEWNLGHDFVKWIDEANIFCNTLVDRIVPGYPKDKIEEITKELGYTDKLVDEGEIFHLWVIEGPKSIREEFPADNLGLNVLFVDDLKPYRSRKVRILNGAHTSMVAPALLYGIGTVKEAVDHDIVGSFINRCVFDEIVPTLDLPEKELIDFANDVMERFKNPFIKHYLMSISLNSMSKFETRVLPSILEYKNRFGTLPKNLVFSLAALIYLYRGEIKGRKIELKEEPSVLEAYSRIWSAWDGSDSGLNSIVTEVLSMESIWKQNLNEIDGLNNLVSKYLNNISRNEIENAIQEVDK